MSAQIDALVLEKGTHLLIHDDSFSQILVLEWLKF